MPDATILVVDDHKPNRDMLSRRLTREGYTVVTAESGAQVFELLPTQKVDLLLLDLMMPDMNGIEVLERLRADAATASLPVLMVSANTDSPQMVAALDRGANDYLTKPVDFEVLLAKLRRYLSEKAPAPLARPVAPTPKPDHLKEGDTLAHYKLGALLGEGGMGRVFRATDTRLLREVAIKVMLGDNLSPQTLERFVLEARAVARVSNPAIVTIYEIGLDPFHYIAMELVHGSPLSEVNPTSVRQSVGWILQVLDALQDVHQRDIVHRDLKPANLMVLHNDRIKVMDFGLAKLLDQNLNLTQSGDTWGTPKYMSPEHVNPDFGPLNAQSDLFAVAVILYEFLTDQSPFNGRNPGQLLYEIMTREPVAPVTLNPDLPVALSDACLHGLKKKQNQRFPDAASFREALAPFG